MARWAAVAGGAFGVVLAMSAGSIIGALRFFYGVLGVCLFVPVIAGLYLRRFGSLEAMCAVGGGIVVMMSLQLATAGRGITWVSPALAGIVVSVVVGGLVVVARVRRVGRL